MQIMVLADNIIFFVALKHYFGFFFIFHRLTLAFLFIQFAFDKIFLIKIRLFHKILYNIIRGFL